MDSRFSQVGRLLLEIRAKCDEFRFLYAFWNLSHKLLATQSAISPAEFERVPSTTFGGGAQDETPPVVQRRDPPPLTRSDWISAVVSLTYLHRHFRRPTSRYTSPAFPLGQSSSHDCPPR